MPERIVIIPSQRSPTAAISGAIAGIVIGLTTILLVADGALSFGVRAIIGIVGGMLAAALFVTAMRLSKPRGGLTVEPEGRGIGVGLTDEEDVYWIPLTAVVGVGLGHFDVKREGVKTRYWSAEILCNDRPSVVLVEATEKEVVEHVLEQLTEGGALTRAPETGDDGEASAPGSSDTRGEDGDVPDAITITGVRRGAALGDVLFMFGISLSAIGAALFAQLANQPMVAVFIGPVLMLMGGVMLAIALVKRYAGEELEVRHNLFHHRWRLGSWSWGERSIDARGLRWRLRVQALKGAYLEAVGSNGIVTIGAGATTRSRTSIEGLNRLPQALSMSATVRALVAASD